jgi:predicted DNA binding protein
MPRAKLTLTIPDVIWIGEISRIYSNARFRILSVLPNRNSGIGLAEITADQLKALLSDIKTYKSIVSLEILKLHDETGLIRFETSNPALLMPIQSSGIALEMPFTLTDGQVTWEITASQSQLSALDKQLEEFGIPFSVDNLQQQATCESFLTERQYEIVETAVDEGYYDTPRECSLTELSETLGIAKSTCSETLHRAEGKVIKRFVNREIKPVSKTLQRKV